MKNGKVALLLEAKKLATDVERREVLGQLARYSFGQGTKYGILTNGAVWALIRSFEEGTTISERLVWKVDIETDELFSVSRKMSTITRDNVAHIEILVKKSQILQEIWQSLLDEPLDLITALTPVVRRIIEQGYPGFEFADDEIQDLLRERVRDISTVPGEPTVPTEPPVEPAWGSGPSRKAMKLGGEEIELRKSLEILVNTAEWLIRRGKLHSSDCPVAVGYRRHLVNLEPTHRDGQSFRQPRKLSNGLFIETHYSTADCINQSKRLLQKFGFSPDTLSIS